ncbi:MAG: hypothetical protein HW421_2742 [Ignavibacteria bacterium]|nr:hypothetical protein [Ignavibacteria bacterium]
MHHIYKITDFKIVAPYTLSIIFDVGVNQIINFSKILKGELLGKLADINYFNQVSLDNEVNTLVWPNGADFDPLTLHDWKDYEENFQSMVYSWS